MAEEKLHFLDEPDRCRLPRQQKVIVALQSYKMRARDCGCHSTPLLKRVHPITARVHHEGRYADLLEEVVDVKLADGLKISDRAVGRRGPPLELVECLGLLPRCIGHHL